MPQRGGAKLANLANLANLASLLRVRFAGVAPHVQADGAKDCSSPIEAETSSEGPVFVVADESHAKV
ncbi:MAG: hypothetical protein JSS56_18450 [Proteobacteria bacterium]|nr:hypothetical protein [Pseudomonadota bacterium]